MGDDIYESFEDMLKELDMCEDGIHKSSKNFYCTSKGFLKSNPNEIWVNQYMKKVLSFFG